MPHAPDIIPPQIIHQHHYDVWWLSTIGTAHERDSDHQQYQPFSRSKFHCLHSLLISILLCALSDLLFKPTTNQSLNPNPIAVPTLLSSIIPPYPKSSV
jgi:hypothetical protein